jgi:hypothetical protein
MKHQKNKHRRDVLLGNLLYLKAGYMWYSWARYINEKVSPPLHEPFVIMEGIGAIAYRLKMPEETKIQAIFHVRKLKKTVPTIYQPRRFGNCNPGFMMLSTFIATKVDLQRCFLSGEIAQIVTILGRHLRHCNSLFPCFPLRTKSKLRGAY